MGQKTNLNELTTEEIKKLKEERVNFMKESLEGLRVQDEYTRLKANISENALRDHMSKVKLIQMQMPPEKESEKEPESGKYPNDGH